MDRSLQTLSEMALPFAYDHLAEGESLNLPLICYLFSGSDNSSVDGRVYYKINEVDTELYCDSKDLALGAILEAALDKYGIFYNKTGVWIESEKFYGVLYTFEMEVQPTWAIKSSII